MRKKILCVLIVCLSLMVYGCGSNEQDSSEKKEKGASVTEAVVNEPDPTATLTPTSTPTPTVNLSRDVVNEPITLNFTFGERSGLYTGHLNENGLPEGYGEFYRNVENGWTYRGEFINGHFYGKGEIVSDEEDTLIEAGTYTKDEFTPTFGEIVNSLGISDALYFGRFEVPEKLIKFIDSQKEYYPQAKAEQLSGIALQEFSAKQFKKTREQDNPGMVKLNLTAQQAFEDKVDDLWGYNGYITSILAYDSNYDRYAIYLFD